MLPMPALTPVYLAQSAAATQKPLIASLKGMKASASSSCSAAGTCAS